MTDSTKQAREQQSQVAGGGIVRVAKKVGKCGSRAGRWR